jgi:hypothetical protein
MNIAGAVDAAEEAAATQAQAKSSQVKTDLDMLHYDIERLLMITEAIWSILKEKYNLEDSELVNRVIEIDQRDGRLDGRVAQGPPPACPKCGRTLERRRPYCLYCGQAIARDPFER